MSSTITMSRNQILKLGEYIAQFKDVQTATITSDNSSGIGDSIVVHMDFTTPTSVTVDLTEYENW